MSKSQHVKAGILLISTLKYKQFVQPLINQIDDKFLPEHEKIIFLFTDEYQRELESKSRVIQILIPAYKFPFATLYRYKIFRDNEDELKMCSHLYYLDVDMAVISKVGNDFLVDEGLIIVRHPGYYMNDGWGDSNNPKESTSYLPKEMRKHYYCGGCQAGTAKEYLKLSKVLAHNIEIDEQNGIIAEWNDETHYNKYVNENFDSIPMKEFTPEYCMPEPQRLRDAWGINFPNPKILALDKNHLEIRS